MTRAVFRVAEAYEAKGVKKVLQNRRQTWEEKNNIWQTKLAALAKKKEQGKLTLEDVNEKLDVIIEMLQDLMPPK